MAHGHCNQAIVPIKTACLVLSASPLFSPLALFDALLLLLLVRPESPREPLLTFPPTRQTARLDGRAAQRNLHHDKFAEKKMISFLEL